MKRKQQVVVWLAAAVLIMLAGPANAEFGIKGGVHFATQRQGGATSLGPQMGFFAGVFFPMTMNPFFTVQPEIMIIQKGSKKEVGEFFVYDVTTKMMSIDAVLISKIHPFQMKTIRPCFLFGPYASYILSGTFEYGSTSEKITEFNSLEAGFVVGAGVDLTLGRSKVAVDIRYNLGWTDIHSVPSSIWNRGLLLSAGFVF